MGIRAAVEADKRGPGGSCPIGLLLAGEVPLGSSSPPLSDAPGSAEEPGSDLTERGYLVQLIGSDISSRKLYRVLRDSGYVVGESAPRKHRVGDCSCTSLLR